MITDINHDQASSDQLRLLVLGGTQFVGRAVVEAALERGHQVSLFNRGQTNPELFDGAVEKLRGDRGKDLDVLAGRSWDAVIDVAAYHPEVVRRSLHALTTATDRYLFVSSVSVYADQSVPPVEGAPVLELTNPADRSPESYGARKAACEQLVSAALGEKATIVRPGLIVGPHDPTDRFAYWPRRISEGGRVLAPGQPSDPLQFIDVRDLGAFIVHLLEGDITGTFNATGTVVSFEDFLMACQRACHRSAELIWVSSDQLLGTGLDPWMGVPLWIAAPHWEAANRVDITRALEAGLVLRDVEQTIKAVIEAVSAGPRMEFSREMETNLLRAAAQT